MIQRTTKECSFEKIEGPSTLITTSLRELTPVVPKGRLNGNNKKLSENEKKT